MDAEKVKRVIEIVKKVGILRPRDLDAYNIPREYLRRLHENGLISKNARGLYSLNDVDINSFKGKKPVRNYRFSKLLLIASSIGIIH